MQEIEVLGYLFSVHPLTLYEPYLAGRHIVKGRDLEKHVGEEVTMAGWWVTNKLVYTKHEEPMSFISFEDTTAIYETVFFPEAFRRHSAFWTPVRPYLLKGRVDDDFGAVSLHVREMRFLGADTTLNRTKFPMGAKHLMAGEME
jgi:error-prone DNA polymerase